MCATCLLSYFQLDLILLPHSVFSQVKCFICNSKNFFFYRLILTSKVNWLSDQNFGLTLKKIKKHWIVTKAICAFKLRIRQVIIFWCSIWFPVFLKFINCSTRDEDGYFLRAFFTFYLASFFSPTTSYNIVFNFCLVKMTFYLFMEFQFNVEQVSSSKSNHIPLSIELTKLNSKEPSRSENFHSGFFFKKNAYLCKF